LRREKKENRERERERERERGRAGGREERRGDGDLSLVRGKKGGPFKRGTDRLVKFLL
jgi:hypothetical protein